MRKFADKVGARPAEQDESELQEQIDCSLFFEVGGERRERCFRRLRGWRGEVATVFISLEENKSWRVFLIADRIFVFLIFILI